MPRGKYGLHSILIIAILSFCFGSMTGCRFADSRIDFDFWDLPAPGTDCAEKLHSKAMLIEERLFREHFTDFGVLIYRKDFSPNANEWRDLADQTCWSAYLLAAMICKQASLDKGIVDSELEEKIESIMSGLELLESLTGVEGLVARCILPKEEVAKATHNVSRWSNSSVQPEFSFRHDVSKDQYAGLLFGLAVAAEYGQPTIAKRARAYLKRVAVFLQKNDYIIYDHLGRPTRFGDMRPRIASLPIAPHAAMLLNATAQSALAHSVSGQVSKDSSWQQQRLMSCLEPLHFEAFGIRNYNNDVMVSSAVLASAMLNPSVEFTRKLRKLYLSFYGSFKGEGNALFVSTAVHLGIRDEVEEAVALRNLLHSPTDLSIRGLGVESYAQLKTRAWKNRKSLPLSQSPLPLASRPPTSFVWRSDPYAIDYKAQESGFRRVCGVDFLIAYWLGRQTNWIPAYSPPRN